MKNRRTWHRVAGAALALLLLGAVACSSEEPEPVAGSKPAEGSGADEPSTEQSKEPSDQQSPSSSGSVTYEVWFADHDGLAPVWRSQASTPRVGTAALEQLLRGPASGDAGLSSAIPSGTELLGLTIDGGTARVDLTDRYQSGGGSLSMNMRLAQVVFTLTQFPTVRNVAFLLDGEPVETFSGEGLVLDQPLGRADFEDLAPPIIVDEPSSGRRISSPVSIAGTANVFEATVSIRILDSNGKQLARTFTTATCGTGCRGDYAKKVSFSVDEAQPGIVEVFEESAEDGRPTNVVRVPVTLQP